MKKRILHISKYYYPFLGGTEQTARDCVFALREKYEQLVISFNDKKRGEIDIVDETLVIKCGSWLKVSSQSISISYIYILSTVIKMFKPDIIVFHYPNPYVASILLKLIKRKNIKLVTYWHLDITKQKLLKYLFYSQNKKILEMSYKIIATSPNYIEGSKWLRSVKEKCVVIPSCVNKERMIITREIEEEANKIREDNNGKVICVSVGRHTEYKGLKYLIRASKLLDDKFHFFITGSGELTESLYKEAGEDSKITFTGVISDDKLKALLLASDIFCFPSISKNEAFGLALAEGMYYGKPAVTFKINGSGVNYVCIDRENGIEVENMNIDKYAKALELLAEDKELREKYGKAGKKRVEDNFINTKFYSNIERLFKDI